MSKQSSQGGTKSVAGMYFFTAAFAGLLLYFGFQELRYSLSGATAVAKVTHKTQETRSNGKGGGTHQVFVLDYSFQDTNRTRRTGRDEVPVGWSFGPDESVTVEYIRGAGGASRVKGLKSFSTVLLIFGIPAVIGQIVIGVLSLHNAKASVELPPLSNRPLPDAADRDDVPRQWSPAPATSNISSIELADSDAAEPSEPRGRKARKLKRRQERESRSHVHQQNVKFDDSGTPDFSTGSLVCRYAGWMGKPVSVIVDRSAGMIHFQNCLRLAKFWAIATETWFSCPWSELTAAHDFTYKGQRSLSIVTRSGTARISSKASNFESLCQTLPAIIPGGGRAFSTEHPGFGFLLAIGAMGGFVLGIYLTPKGASDATLWLMMMGSAFAVLMTLLGGARLLTRP